MPAVTRPLPPPVALVTTTAAMASAAPMPTPPRKRGALRVFQLTPVPSSDMSRPPATAASPGRRAYVVPELSSRRGQDQLHRPKLAHRPRARRGDGALAAVRNAAARDPVDPLARPRCREGVLARLEPDLPAGDRRASAEGALPRLRLGIDRLRVLRLAAVSPGGRRAERDALRRAARVRALEHVHRAAEGGAPLHEQPRLESGRRRRHPLGAPARALQRGGDRRARRIRRAHVRAAARDQDLGRRPLGAAVGGPRRPEGGKRMTRVEAENPFALHEGAAETWAFIERNVLESGLVDRAL